MLRSNTMSKMKAQSSEYPKGKAGQKAIGPAPGEEEKRHFDPSRDPKLLGLL